MIERVREGLRENHPLILFSLLREAFKTATVDRGKEFSCYATIEKE